MDVFQETVATWDKIASLYASKFMDLDIYNDTYDQFLSMLEEGANRILEVGCGPGNVSRYLIGKKPDLQIEGLDVAPNMVALAAMYVPAGKFRVMNALDIHQLDPGYGAIVAGFFLPYCSPDLRLAWLTDCWKLLSENGVFYLSFVPGDSTDSGFKTGTSGDRTYFYYHPLADVIRELETIGFGHLSVMTKEFDKTDGHVEEHIILLAQKIS